MCRSGHHHRQGRACCACRYCKRWPATQPRRWRCAHSRAMQLLEPCKGRCTSSACFWKPGRGWMVCRQGCEHHWPAASMDLPRACTCGLFRNHVCARQGRDRSLSPGTHLVNDGPLNSWTSCSASVCSCAGFWTQLRKTQQLRLLQMLCRDLACSTWQLPCWNGDGHQHQGSSTMAGVTLCTSLRDAVPAHQHGTAIHCLEQADCGRTYALARLCSAANPLLQAIFLAQAAATSGVPGCLASGHAHRSRSAFQHTDLGWPGSPA